MSLVARVSRDTEAKAIERVLPLLPGEHYGYVHSIPGPFEYQPAVCPGCAYSVLRAMAEKRGEGS